MRSCRKLFVVAVACAGVLCTGGVSLAQDKGKEKKKNRTEKSEGGKKKKNKKSSDEEDGKLSLPILKGHDAFGLKIPYRDAEGQLQMMFHIGKASRVDENRVSMADMQLETFDDSGEPEMTIELPQSELDLQTRVITTDSNVTIKRSDFEISGRSMEFNTQTKQGRLAGNVRMLIYNLDGKAAPDNAEPTTTP